MKDKTTKIKILIAEDNELFRTSLLIALEREEDFEIVGTCSNGKECLEAVQTKNPDLILMDIDMPVMNGLSSSKLIKNTHEKIKIIIFSVYTDEESVLDALQARADAYCTKDTSFEKLIEVIHTVMEGALWLDPSIASYIHNFVIRSNTNQTGNSVDNFNLSQRELEVLALMADGKSNKEIAKDLFITVNTSKAHVCNIIQKLSAKDRTDAAVKASKHGLV